MNRLTKLALGSLGLLEPQPARAADMGAEMDILPPCKSGGMPLMQALRERQSLREFAPTALAAQTLSDLLWAAAGLATVTRAWIDRGILAHAMHLGAEQSILLSQTVGCIMSAAGWRAPGGRRS